MRKDRIEDLNFKKLNQVGRVLSKIQKRFKIPIWDLCEFVRINKIKCFDDAIFDYKGRKIKTNNK